MFSKQIIDSDMFLDMPVSAQALYFHLAMRADDEGFLNNPSKIMKIVGANKNDMDLLLIKRFIIDFPSGIVVIKHWYVHNYIQKDRFKPTVYNDEKLLLDYKENKVYTLRSEHIDLFSDDEKNTNVYSLDTQVRLGKVSLVEDSKEKSIKKKNPPTISKHKHGSQKNVLLTDEELQKLKEKFTNFEDLIENLSMYMGSTGKSYSSHYLTILNWNRKETGNGKDSKPTEKNQYIPRRDRQSGKDETSNS
jgi:hypothetical protein